MITFKIPITLECTIEPKESKLTSTSFGQKETVYSDDDKLWFRGNARSFENMSLEELKKLDYKQFSFEEALKFFEALKEAKVKENSDEITVVATQKPIKGYQYT